MRHITHLRNRAFMEQCRKSARSLRMRGRRPSEAEIVRHALAQPAPRYFVDFYRATHILKNFDMKGRRNSRSYAGSRQWEDMAHDLAALRAQHPRASVNRLILDLCTGRAGRPRFYMSARRALELFKS